MSLAGLTQESHDVDVTTISSDDEAIDPEENFRLLLEGAWKLSNNISQVSHFNDKIFSLSHRSNTTLDGSGFSQLYSNSMTSSMECNLK